MQGGDAWLHGGVNHRPPHPGQIHILNPSFRGTDGSNQGMAALLLATARLAQFQTDVCTASWGLLGPLVIILVPVPPPQFTYTGLSRAVGPRNRFYPFFSSSMSIPSRATDRSPSRKTRPAILELSTIKISPRILAGRPAGDGSSRHRHSLFLHFALQSFGKPRELQSSLAVPSPKIPNRRKRAGSSLLMSRSPHRTRGIGTEQLDQ